MKNLYKIVLLLTFIVVLSCKKEYIEPNQFSDISWYSSQFQNANYFLALNDYVSFSDLSQGTTSHKWQLLDDGCYFMAGDMTLSDSIYDQYLIDGAGKESAEKTIHVLFKEPGLKRIRLYNEFPDSVAFVGTYGTASATRKGDSWVFDTSFVIDVFDTITPAYKVYKMDGTEIVLQEDANPYNWVVQKVEEGDTLLFVDMSVLGRPNERTWNFGTGQVDFINDSVAYAIYYSLGFFNTTIRARRNSPLMPGGFKYKMLPLFVEVEQSSRPFEMVSASQESNNLIYIQLNGSIDEESIVGQLESFTIHANNIGFDSDLAIQSVKVHESGSKLEIHLAEDIYNTDAVTITYADGEILSGGGRELQPFTDEPLTMKIVNLLGEGYNFEEGAGIWYAGSDDADDATKGSQGYSTTDPAEGSYCYHMEVTEDNNRQSAMYPELFPMTNGAEYVLKYKAKLVSSGGAGGYEFRINRGGVIDDRYEGNWHGYASLTIGAWVEVEKSFTYTEDDADMGVQMLVYRIAELYFDDLLLYEKENRP